jgi:hypothetical protein
MEVAIDRPPLIPQLFGNEILRPEWAYQGERKLVEKKHRQIVPENSKNNQAFHAR